MITRVLLLSLHYQWFEKVNEREEDYNEEKWTTQPRAQAQLVRAFPSVPDRLMPSVPASCF